MKKEKKCNLTHEERHKLNNLLMSTSVGIIRLHKYIKDQEACYEMIDHVTELKKVSEDLLEMFEELKNVDSCR